MKRFALFASAFIWLAACDTPSAPTPPTPTLKMVPVGAPSSTKIANYTYDISGYVYNPCPPAELVLVQGSIHVLITGEQTPTSADLKFHLNTQGVEGVGVTSGDKYNWIVNEKEDLQYSFPPFQESFEFDERWRVIRQGSADNLWYRITYRYTYPPGNLEIIRQEFECRG